MFMYDKSFKGFRYVCPYCFNEWKDCACMAYPQTLIQIDKKILPTIRVLNQKHYFTDSCCEGHVGDGDFIYIIFRKTYKIKTFPKGFSGSGDGVRADITGKSIEARKRKKRALHAALYQWACELEER